MGVRRRLHEELAERVGSLTVVGEHQADASCPNPCPRLEAVEARQARIELRQTEFEARIERRVDGLGESWEQVSSTVLTNVQALRKEVKRLCSMLDERLPARRKR